MAEEFGDGEFWLPSEFLCDDFFVEEGRMRRAEAAFVLRQRLGSKVEPHAAAAVADTASIEEYMATITRQMAQASIVVTEKAKVCSYLRSELSSFCFLSRFSPKLSNSGHSWWLLRLGRRPGRRILFSAPISPLPGETPTTPL